MERKRAIGLGIVIGAGIAVGMLAWNIHQFRQQEQKGLRLFRAIQKDDVASVRKQLESGTDANTSVRQGNPPSLVDLAKIALHLHPGGVREHYMSVLQAATGDPEIVRLLVAHGARVNEMVDGWPPLAFALEPTNDKPRPEVVQFLLEHGANPNARYPGTGGAGPLSSALDSDGNMDCGPLTKLLLEYGADPMQEEHGGRTCLTSEIRNHHLKTVAFMLNHGADINARDKDNGGTPGGPGTTALGAAISAGHLDMIQMLLARGARIEPKDGEGLISDAVHAHDERFLKALLARGVSIDGKTWQGMTPLMNTAFSSLDESQQESEIACMKILLAHGASVRARNNDGQTPLMVACNYPKDLPQLKILLAHGADPNATDKQGSTALDYAAMQEAGGGASVAYLLAHGANARHVANGGFTPLMSMAINKGDLKGVPLLVTAGCDPNAKEKTGKTALMLAALHKNTAVLQALRKAGATH